MLCDPTLAGTTHIPRPPSVSLVTIPPPSDADYQIPQVQPQVVTPVPLTVTKPLPCHIRPPRRVGVAGYPNCGRRMSASPVRKPRCCEPEGSRFESGPRSASNFKPVQVAPVRRKVSFREPSFAIGSGGSMPESNITAAHGLAVGKRRAARRARVPRYGGPWISARRAGARCRCRYANRRRQTHIETRSPAAADVTIG